MKPGETVDHVDQNTSNNLLSNLRAATNQQQNLNRSCDFRTAQSSQKDVIEGRPLRDPLSPWERFESKIDASRVLSSRLGCKIDRANLVRVINGEYKQTNGWVFREVKRL